jgi:hypothetical protein
LVSSNCWPLYCLSFDLQLLITPLISSNILPLYYLSLLYDFWLPLWHLQFVLVLKQLSKIFFACKVFRLKTTKQSLIYVAFLSFKTKKSVTDVKIINVKITKRILLYFFVETKRC